MLASCCRFAFVQMEMQITALALNMPVEQYLFGGHVMDIDFAWVSRK
jgi:hypothetical protein